MNLNRKPYTDLSNKEMIFIYILILCSFRFYSYNGFNDTIVKLAQFAIFPLILFKYWNLFFTNINNTIVKLVKWILLITIMSIFMAFLYHKQSPIWGYCITSLELNLCIYFYLLYRRPSPKSIEQIIWTFGILFCILWLCAMYSFPDPIFGSKEELNEDISRGMIRIRVTGVTCLVLSFFLSLNQIYITKKKRYIIITIILFIFIILNLSRQVILFSGIIALLFIFYKNPKFLSAISIILLLTIWLGGKVIKFNDDSIMGALINVTVEQSEKNESDDDIRIKEYRYFFTEYSKHFMTQLLGNGLPHANSEYGEEDIRIQEELRYFYTDVGYAKMYFVTGIIGLALYLILFFKTLFLKLPPEFQYAKLFMYYFIPANIAASWFSSPDGQISLCIVLYIFTIYPTSNTAKNNIKK